MGLLSVNSRLSFYPLREGINTWPNVLNYEVSVNSGLSFIHQEGE